MSSQGDKTEAPTPKKKKDSRKKGQIARTPDLSAWIQVLVASVVIEVTISRATTTLGATLLEVRDAIARPDEAAALGLFGRALAGALLAVAPLAGAMVVVGVVSGAAQTGGFASLSMLKPKPERISPIKGAKRLVSPQSLWMGAKAGLKVLALTVVAWPPIEALTRELAAGGSLALSQVVPAVARSGVQIARNTAALGLVIALLDYAISKRKVVKGMKMTKQEVRDEHRQSEGDPHVRSHIRSKQLSVSRNRMIAAVADADVVVVNPVHVAVALAYEPGRGAPRVVASGKGDVATRIRERAEEHGIPLVRDIPLARTLEASVPVGGEIPADLYEAVARILAFIATVGQRARAFGAPLTVPA